MIRGTRTTVIARLARAGIKFLLVFAIFHIGSQAGRAQVAEAAVGGEERASGGGLVSAFHVDYGKRWLGGIGMYVDVNLNPHLGLEGEARWLSTHEESGAHLSTYLGGPRYTFNALGKFRPYAKMLVGVGEFHFPYGYAQGSYLVLAAGGGLDYRVSHRIRIRLVDIEYQQWPMFTFGSMGSYGASAGAQYYFR